MRIAYWMTDYSHSTGIRNTYCSSSATVVAPNGLTVTLNTHNVPRLFVLLESTTHPTPSVTR